MSFESTEERIDKLESTVNGLIVVQTKVVKMFEQDAVMLAVMAKQFVLLSNSQVATLKFVLNMAPPLDPKVKQDFADHIARLEQYGEKMEAMMAQFKTPPAEGIEL